MGRGNTPSDEDRLIAKIIVTEDKVKGAILDFPTLNQQDWMASIQQYSSRCTPHSSGWDFQCFLSPEINLKGMERGQVYLYTKSIKDGLLHSKSLSANLPLIVLLKDAGEADRKVDKGCANEITTIFLSTCIY